MTTTLAELIKTTTSDDLFRTQLQLLDSAGFPTTSWHDRSVPKKLVRADADTLADVWALIPQIARSGFVGLAEKGWLDLLLEQNYQLTRKPAVTTRRRFRVSNAANAGYPYSDGQFWVRSTGGLELLFRSTGSGTIGAAS